MLLLGCASQVRIAPPEVFQPAQPWHSTQGEIWLKADSVFALRADPAKLREAEHLYAEAVIRQADVPALLTRWSRACYLTALHGGLEPEKRRALYRRGVDAGKRALAMHPGYALVMAENSDEVEAAGLVDGPYLEAAFWVAANEGRWLTESDRFVRRGRADGIAALVSRMLAVADTLYAGGPHRLAAAMALSLPNGSDDLAQVHFAAAQRIAPEYLGNQTAYAEFYAVATGDRNLYVRLLEAAIAQESDSNLPLAPENQLEKLRARRLLRDVDALFPVKSTRADP